MKYSKHFAAMLKKGEFANLDAKRWAEILNIVYAEARHTESVKIGKAFNLLPNKDFQHHNFLNSMSLTKLTQNNTPEFLFDWMKQMAKEPPRR